MQNLSNEELINALIATGYNAQINNNEEIEEAVEILNNEKNEEAENVDMARTMLINYIIDNNRQVAGSKTKSRRSRKRKSKRTRKTKSRRSRKTKSRRRK